MDNVLKYKGYTGSVEFSADDNVFHGRVLGIKDMISFEGAAVEELKKDFHNGIDHYLEVCEKVGDKPEKPFSGKFVLRIPSDLHCLIALKAKDEKKSINTWLIETCESTLVRNR
ncbi:MAG: type II toxin-antitoxin system HicB family antitoxin [Deltaproteobacteria bacterium]|jgi:predicted HicB family RNase H-like nuclease|nr:type II toxin-antitoxin system HicB family antitoxin [Deltaproteobacteria bacterium]